MAQKKQYPPFGRDLAERLKFKNPPFLVFVCLGRDAWTTAKNINGRNSESCAIVVPAERFSGSIKWPVKNCTVVVHWSTGPNVDQLINLSRELLNSRASQVIVFPAFEDHSKPYSLFDTNTQTWHRIRNGITIYKDRG